MTQSNGSDAQVGAWFRGQPASRLPSGAPQSNATDAEIGEWFRGQPIGGATSEKVFGWFTGQPASNNNSNSITSANWFTQRLASYGSDATTANWFGGLSCKVLSSDSETLDALKTAMRTVNRNSGGDEVDRLNNQTMEVSPMGHRARNRQTGRQPQTISMYNTHLETDTVIDSQIDT